MRASLLVLVTLSTLCATLACSSEEAAEAPDQQLSRAGSSGKGGSGGQAGAAGKAGAAGSAGKTGGTGGGGAAGAAGKGGAAGGASCQESAPCKRPDGKAGLCAGGACCEAALACGEVCCDAGDVCSFQKCVKPGSTCRDTSDCEAKEYCETALSGSGAAGAGGSGSSGQAGAAGAAGSSGASGQAGAGGGCFTSPPEGRCLPLPPTCEGAEVPPGELTCLPTCEVKPAPAPFAVELKYSWGGQIESPYATDVMMAPIVIQLDDDDCDGEVTARDIPEIVFTTFTGGAYGSVGTIHAISVVQGQVVEKWSVPDLINPSTQLAAGNIDGLPGNEVVACGQDGYTYALNGKDGTILWKSPEKVSCYLPSIADMDQDGKPEIVDGSTIINGKDGTLKSSLGTGALSIVADMDGDGTLEVVSPSRIVRADGTLVADCGIAGGLNAVGDLDKDGIPEVVSTDSSLHKLFIWHLDPKDKTKAEVVRANIDINALFDPNGCGPPPGGLAGYPGGGPPTVADFNGDGFPDIALAGGLGYVIVDGKKAMDTSVPEASTFLWVKDTQDCSSASTGSSIFDFNGDGKAEVLYGDEIQFRIYDGPTGNTLFETCNTSGTLIEFPVVADVDGDDQADIIVASNAYAFACPDGTKTAGIRIFGSKNNDWVRTRRVWNQHGYYVSNVNEDGSIPKVEAINWKQPGLNNFRQNKQPGLEFAAPDAVVSVRPACDAQDGIIAEVRNVGQSALAAGAVVTLYKGEAPPGEKLGELVTTRILYPGQAELLTFQVQDPDVKSGKKKVFASVTAQGDNECRDNNNASQPSIGSCQSNIN